MKDYKKFILSRGGEELGILFSDIKENLLTPADYKRFEEFMSGQTITMIGLNEGVCFTGDYERFIKGLPVVD